MENFSFNTAVARLMEYLNALNKYDTTVEKKNNAVFIAAFKNFIKLLAPCAPHYSEEIWEWLGGKGSVFNTEYPVCDEKALVKDTVEIAVQINSKMKSRIEISNDATNDEIKEIILSDEKLSAEIGGKEIKKLIVVPGRLVNMHYSDFKHLHH